MELTSSSADPGLARFEQLAKDLVAVYGAGDADALQRLADHFGQSLTADDVRARVRERLATPGFDIAAAQLLVARFYAFESWARLVESAARSPGDPRSAPLGMSTTPPFYKIDWTANTIEVRPPVSDKEWDIIFAVMEEHGITGLRAGGPMTDAAMARLPPQVTTLHAGGSKRLTDAGLLHLARMPQLQELDLSEDPGGRITDRGLEVLRHLPELRRFSTCWQRGITDAGVANLAFCDRLESVDLMGTPTGDGAINALTAKRTLRRFKSGKLGPVH